MSYIMEPYQALIHPSSWRGAPYADEHVFDKTYMLQISDKSWLEIPLCALPGGKQAIALMMSNQSSFQVIEHLTTLMAQKASTLEPDCIVAVPTMGLEYASRIAQKLGHEHYVAMGFSHKFWYNEALSEAVVSTTSPDQSKRLYIDPALLERVKGKRVVVVDDVINTGSSVSAAVSLLKKAGANIVGVTLALTEGFDWRDKLTEASGQADLPVLSVGHIPMFERNGQGWSAEIKTLRK